MENEDLVELLLPGGLLPLGQTLPTSMKVSVCTALGGRQGGGSIDWGEDLTLSLRVNGCKTYVLTTPKGARFSLIMGGVCEALGVVLGAAHLAFEFDGQKMRPDSTPREEDMEGGYIMDLSIPGNSLGSELAQRSITIRREQEGADRGTADSGGRGSDAPSLMLPAGRDGESTARKGSAVSLQQRPVGTPEVICLSD
ncbi:unnamed protein product [Discosporangium mesarthrocarpum]